MPISEAIRFNWRSYSDAPVRAFAKKGLQKEYLWLFNQPLIDSWYTFTRAVQHCPPALCRLTE